MRRSRRWPLGHDDGGSHDITDGMNGELLLEIFACETEPSSTPRGCNHLASKAPSSRSFRGTRETTKKRLGLTPVDRLSQLEELARKDTILLAVLVFALSDRVHMPNNNHLFVFCTTQNPIRDQRSCIKEGGIQSAPPAVTQAMLGYDDWPPFLIHYDRARAAEGRKGGEGERVLSRSVGRRERRVGGGSSQRGVRI